MNDSPLERPEIRTLLDLLRARIQGALGAKLAGLYVVGSLVTGDFDPAISDADLIAALAAELDEREAVALAQMHAGIARERPEWDNRIEVVYISADKLKAPQRLDQLAVISPGEPFHVFAVKADDWLLNWYVLRAQGIALVGAAAQTVVAPIALDDLLPHLREQLHLLPDWVADAPHRGAQAYVILTMCRALYLFRKREFVSKPQAARWAGGELPQWSALIAQALAWRQAQGTITAADASERAETQRFARFVIERISGA